MTARRDYAVAAGAAAAAAGGLALGGLALRASAYKSVGPAYSFIVFLDNEATGISKNGVLISHSREKPFACLQAAVCSALQLTNPRLFLLDTKEQLLAGAFDQQLSSFINQCSRDANSSWQQGQVILLLATDASKLSPQAANLAGTALAPIGPR